MDRVFRPLPGMEAQGRRMTNLSSPRARARKGCAMAACQQNCDAG